MTIPHRSVWFSGLIVSVCLAACGADESGDQVPVPVGSNAEPSSGDSKQVLGTGNVGGAVVDPRPYAIDDIEIAESYPEQLTVRFTGGDPNCTAANATATATGSSVVVDLQVGITEDALMRSCLAGDFEQNVTISLDTGLDGRDVVAATS